MFPLFDSINKNEIKDCPIPFSKMGDYMENNFPSICMLTRSTDKKERYWINECLCKLNTLNKYNDIYLFLLEKEAKKIMEVK